MTPWEIEAADLAKEQNLTNSEAVDAVILDWLALGNTKPFCGFVLKGHQPNGIVLVAIAYMMMKGDPDCIPSEGLTRTTLWSGLPFGLEPKGKSKGPRSKAWIKTRNRMIAREVRKQMDAGVAYDGAIATVFEWFNKNVGRIVYQTIRDAYDNEARLAAQNDPN